MVAPARLRIHFNPSGAVFSCCVVAYVDGWGDSVKIPSLLLSEEDANFLISAGDGLYEVDAPQSVVPSRTGGRGNKTVILELVWSLPKDHAVQVDVWTTPSSTQSTKFVKEFAAYAHAFKDKVWPINTLSILQWLSRPSRGAFLRLGSSDVAARERETDTCHIDIP